MASGQDPLADMQNLIGYAGLVGPNPYLEFQGQIPMAGFYTGDAGNLPPTDATGKPIQSFVDYNNNAQTQYQQALAAYNAQPAGGTPGTTLNSTPGQPQVQTSGSWPGQAQGAAAPGSLMATPAMQEMQAGITAAQAAKTPQQLQIDAQNTAMRNQMLQQQANMSTVQAGNGGFGNMPGGAFNPGSYMPLQALMPQGAPAAPAAAGKGPPPSPPDLRQAYLNALANPGKPPSYGAAGPQPGQAPTGAPQQPSAVSAFLAANAGKSTPFLNTLRQMQTG